MGQAPFDLDRADHERLSASCSTSWPSWPSNRSCSRTRPTSRARALALAIAGPAGGRTIDDLARSVGASRRTLERAFLAETGLTIGAWRQRQRLLRALELLAQGEPVTTVAGAVGYRTPSAFTAMFHEHLGTTPTRYFQPDRSAARPASPTGPRPRSASSAVPE